MKLGKQRWWWCAAMLMAAILAFVLAQRAHHEPTFQGRTITSWLHEAEMEPTLVTENGPATRAVCSLGAEAVPFLVTRLYQEDSPWVQYYYQQHPKFSRKVQSWLPKPRRPDSRQNSAAMLLYEVGLPARAAVPDLIAVYNRAYLDRYHLSRGRNLDWSALLTNPPPITLAAGPIPLAPESGLRRLILLTLARIGGEDKQIIPLLLASIHEHSQLDETGVQIWLRSDNTNLASAIQLSEPILLTALNDNDSSVRATAAELLGRLVPTHPEVISPLIKAAGDTGYAVRKNALESLCQTRLDLERTLPMLGPRLTDDDLKVRYVAARLLFKCGGGAKLFPALGDSLSSANPLVRLGAIQALRNFSLRAQFAVPKLEELTRAAAEPDERVRQEAAKALEKIAPQAASP